MARGKEATMNPKKLRMKVYGMTCDHCEATIAAALEEAGARDASADYRREEAVFTIEGEVDEARLAEAVRGAGYRPGGIEVLEAEQNFGGGRVGTPGKTLCPNCRQAGKSVDAITLKA